MCHSILILNIIKINIINNEIKVKIKLNQLPVAMSFFAVYFALTIFSTALEQICLICCCSFLFPWITKVLEARMMILGEFFSRIEIVTLWITKTCWELARVVHVPCFYSFYWYEICLQNQKAKSNIIFNILSGNLNEYYNSLINLYHIRFWNTFQVTWIKSE